MGRLPAGGSTTPRREYIDSKIFAPNTSDWLGRWRMQQTAQNDYSIDREKQRSNQSYTGIDGVHAQDQAITESMGTVLDRSNEHLGSSDTMVIRTRRRMLDVVKAVRDSGAVPP